MKELTIQIRVNNGQVATLMTKQGFDESISSQNEIIGLLYNTLSNEQAKLKTILTSVKQNNDNDEL
jgi:hypothetical protein